MLYYTVKQSVIISTPGSWWANAKVWSSSRCLWVLSRCFPETIPWGSRMDFWRLVHELLLFSPTLIMTMWDSSRISRKLGFRTDKLMLATAGQHKRRSDMTRYHTVKTTTAKHISDGLVDRTLGVDMIFNVPLGAWSLLQIGTAGHLHLLPAPDQTQSQNLLSSTSVNPPVRSGGDVCCYHFGRVFPEENSTQPVALCRKRTLLRRTFTGSPLRPPHTSTCHRSLTSPEPFWGKKTAQGGTKDKDSKIATHSIQWSSSSIVLWSIGKMFFWGGSLYCSTLNDHWKKSGALP